MLTIARRKAARIGLQNVGFETMGAASLRLQDESFDVVISCCGTPELASDVVAFLSEVLRVLRPGGRFCFCEWRSPSTATEIANGVF